MSDRLGMIHAIHAEHDDDLPRLAYADWLEERGEVEHAEFIRLELRLARLPSDHEDHRRLFERELDLIRAHKNEWFGTFRSGWDHYEMRRGFIEEVSSRTPTAVVPYADWLFSHHALLYLSVTGEWPKLRPLLRHPLAGILAQLRLVNTDSVVGSGWYSLPSLPREPTLARRPLVLSLTRHRAGPEMIDDLLGSPHRARVAWLDLSGNRLTAVGLEKLLDAMPSLPRLKTLHLAGSATPDSVIQTNIGPDGVDVLAHHPAAAQLVAITLSWNAIERANVQALIGSPFLDRIEMLRIDERLRPIDSQRLRQHFGERADLPSDR
jgi:uncharacterized protein (TIGR02996 family)